MSLNELAPKDEKVEKTGKPKKRFHVNKVVLLLVAIVATIGLAIGWVFLGDPLVAKWNAEKELQKTYTMAEVTAYNTDAISFTPSEEETLNGTNPAQLALGHDGEISDTTYFEFRSANSTDSSHVVDVYLDFYSQKSRDFISYSQNILSNNIASGAIVLRVHPVVQTDGFSIYAPEALAEVFAAQPKLAWSFFVNLMVQSDKILSPNVVSSASASADDSSSSDSSEKVSNEKILDFIEETAKSVGISTGACTGDAITTCGVDADSIKYLTFFSWLYSGTSDPKLDTGYYPPIMYIDDQEVDQDTYELSDPDKVAKLFDSLD